MPSQDFSISEHEPPLAQIRWDFGYQAVEVAYDGSLLTRIADPESLRGTGMEGPAPDGAILHLRLVPGRHEDTFELSRNGQAMLASDPNVFGAGVRTFASAPDPLDRFESSKKQRKQLSAGRRWLCTMGPLSIGFGVLLLKLAAHPLAPHPDGIRASAYGAGAVGVAYLLLGLCAFDRYAPGVYACALLVLALSVANSYVASTNAGSDRNLAYAGMAITILSGRKILSAWNAATRVARARREHEARIEEDL